MNPEVSIITKVQEKLNVVQGILNKPSKNRTDRDLEQLVPLIKSIEFFHQRDIKDQDLPDIVACLTYEFVKQGKEVFEYGSTGDKFYIILSGSVGVMIPNPDCRDFKQRYDALQRQKVLHQQQHAAQAQHQQSPLRTQKTFGFGKDGSSTISNRNSKKLSLKAPVLGKKAMSTNFSILQGSQQSIQAKNDSFSKSKGDSSFKNGSPDRKKEGGAVREDLSEVDDRDEEDLDDMSVSEEELTTEREQEKDKPPMLTLQQNKTDKFVPRESFLRRSNQPLFIEASVLKSGKAFGELALIKNKPRAATIKCLEDTHLAVMSKGDYEKVLQKIEQKNMNKIIEFLHQLPYFRVWTRTSLGKLQYSFEQRNYIRNQIVYREGESPSMVYIIKNGEFEVNKKFKKEDIKEIDAVKLLHPKKNIINNQENQQQDTDQDERVVKSEKKINFGQSQIQLASKQRNIETFKLSLIGPGQMFGEDDVVHERNYTSTVICRSNGGVVFAIRTAEFFKKLKSNDECWKIILSQVNSKELQMNKRMNKLDYVFHKEQVHNEPKSQQSSPSKVTGQNQTRQKQYPSILQKHNMVTTQKRIDDFRETLKEIVRKQKREDSVDSMANKITIDLKEVDLIDEKMRHSYNVNLSANQRNIQSPMKIYNEADGVDSPPHNARLKTTMHMQRRNIQQHQRNTLMDVSRNYQSMVTTQTQLENGMDESLAQYSNCQMYVNSQPMFNTQSSSPFTRNIANQNSLLLGNRSKILHKTAAKSISRQRILIMNHAKRVQDANQLSLSPNIIRENYGNVALGSLSHEKSFSQISQMFSSTYDGINQYMSVAHTLKPNQLRVKGSNHSIYQIAPHLQKYNNIQILKYLKQTRPQTNSGGYRTTATKDTSAIMIQQDNLNSSFDAQEMKVNSYMFYNGVEGRKGGLISSQKKVSNGIKNFTNLSINQTRIDKSNNDLTLQSSTMNIN